MGMVRMGRKKNNILVMTENGQSMVEYMMLLGVVLTMTFSILQSKRFQDFFGKESPVLNLLRERMIYSYRHGSFGEEDISDYNSAKHDTYKIPTENKSRFFTPLEAYP